MRARILQSIAICGLLAVAVLTTWAFVPEKQLESALPDPQRERAIKRGNWKHQEVCPVGHETDIVMGQMHLHVDMRVTALLQLEDFQEIPTGCPTDPIFARSMSFDHILGTKEYDALIESRGLPLNHMDLDRIVPERYREPTEVLENPDRRIAVEGIGYVDDITESHHSPHSRRYLLHYIDLVELGDAPSTITMLCHGNVQTNRWRYCSTRYRYGDVRVEYEFRQETDFPHAKGKQVPIKEPEGFLTVDMGVRAWISDMLRSEGKAQ